MNEQKNKYIQSNDEIFDVPKDGNCLFWATMLAYLEPVKADNEKFKSRYIKLFSTDDNYEKIFNFSNFDFENNKNLVLLFRNNVVKYMKENSSDFLNFQNLKGYNNDFNQYLTNMKKNGIWGGELEIKAISDLLKTKIHTNKYENNKLLLSKTYSNSESSNNSYENEIKIIHINDNHYQYYLSNQINNINNQSQNLINNQPITIINTIRSNSESLYSPKSENYDVSSLENSNYWYNSQNSYLQEYSNYWYNSQNSYLQEYSNYWYNSQNSYLQEYSNYWYNSQNSYLQDKNYDLWKKLKKEKDKNSDLWKDLEKEKDKNYDLWKDIEKEENKNYDLWKDLEKEKNKNTTTLNKVIQEKEILFKEKQALIDEKNHLETILNKAYQNQMLQKESNDKNEEQIIVNNSIHKRVYDNLQTEVVDNQIIKKSKIQTMTSTELIQSSLNKQQNQNLNKSNIIKSNTNNNDLTLKKMLESNIHWKDMKKWKKQLEEANKENEKLKKEIEQWKTIEHVVKESKILELENENQKLKVILNEKDKIMISSPSFQHIESELLNLENQKSTINEYKPNSLKM